MQNIPLIFQLHTPEELVFFSNIAHWIEGGIFLVIAAIALLQTRGYFLKGWTVYLWPFIVFLSGLFLPIFVFIHHSDEFDLAIRASLADPQQVQHLSMAILLMIGGIGEIFSIRSGGKNILLKLIFPTVILIIGGMFLLHPQHGTAEALHTAKIVHNALGTVLVLTGILRFFASFFAEKRKWLLYPWIFFLIISAILLITYHEPPGSYSLEPTIMKQQKY